MKIKTHLTILGIRILGKIPLKIAHTLAAAIGTLLYYCPNSLRFKVRRNISRCLAHYSEDQREIWIRNSLKHIIQMVLEMPTFWTAPTDHLLTLILRTHNEDLVEQAYRAGKGVILLGPHLGAWELSILYLSKRYPMYAMYKPQKDPAIDHFVHAARERLGTVMVPTNASGIRTLYKALKQGKVLGILPDHDPGPHNGGEFAPFFGIPTRTMSLINQLARKTGCAVFFGYAKRLPKTQGYEIHFQAADPDIASSDTITGLTAMNQGIEKLVMTAPEQYEWGVRRFRHRPPGEPDFYQK